GTVTVAGIAQTVSIQFGALPTSGYVTFVELGLPNGTSWNVTIGGVVHSSTTAIINLTLPFGTYTYTIGNVSGYSYSVTSLSPTSPITVSASNPIVGVGVVYTQNPTTSSSGLSTLDWILIGVVVVIVIVGLVAALLMRRRGGSAAPAKSSTPPPPPPQTPANSPEGESTYGGGKA
ncbi:membrane protein, partial [mine drainage metagenome]